MKTEYSLGIDTSCYTTSFAVISSDRQVIYNSQILLEVEPGARGLRQSNGIFKHIQNIPNITHELSRAMDTENIVVVSSSTRPRPIAESYMPVFKVGDMVGRTISDFLRVPFYPTSHQETHIEAGKFSAGGPRGDNFLAIHFSGGTSELLVVEDTGAGYGIEIIGNTQDLHAGQFVDRIGVSMGLSFPAGPELEKLAMTGRDYEIDIPVFVRDMTIGFSGAETYTKRLIGEYAKSDIAMAVYNCLANTLYRWILNAVSLTKITDVLLVGGVTSSYILRQKLHALFERDTGIELFFADPGLAKDNALGTALIGLKHYEGKKTDGS